MCQAIKCLFLGHDLKKEQSGFDPRTGNFFIAWRCKKCKKLMVERCTKYKENEELRII